MRTSPLKVKVQHMLQGQQSPNFTRLGNSIQRLRIRERALVFIYYLGLNMLAANRVKKSQRERERAIALLSYKTFMLTSFVTIH